MPNIGDIDDLGDGKKIKEKGKKYKRLEREIIQERGDLIEIDSGNSLIGLINVVDETLRWTPEFGERYKGLPVPENLAVYLSDLKKEVESFYSPNLT